MSGLPRGLRVIRGYVQYRIYTQGKCLQKHFGPDCQEAREAAAFELAKLRKDIRAKRLGLEIEIRSRRFKDVAEEYYAKWSEEKDSEGKLKHGSAREAQRVIQISLLPAFGRRYFETIRAVDVLRWREIRLRAVLGTSVNREQAVLSSIFGYVEQWVRNEEWPIMKLPVDQQTGKVLNPCLSVEKAPNRMRKRVLSTLEIKALKEACYALKDEDMWEICGMALRSLLRKKDLFNLETGMVDTVQAKTSRPISLPVHLSKPLNFSNFRKRWEEVRRSARLVDVQFRDLRKTGANLLKMKNHSNKLISEFLGHSSTDITEIYMVKNTEHLKPLAKDLEDILGAI